MENSSLDRLAHIANMSHELHQRGGPMDQVKREQSQMMVENPNSDMAQIPSHGPKEAMMQEASKALKLESQYSNKSKKMACTGCRQQKSKCDAYEKHPQPCTQCFKKGLPCEVKAEFRRKGKRAQIARIEQEFLELKRAFQDPNATQDLHRAAPNLAAYIDSGSISHSQNATPLHSASPMPQMQTLDPLLSNSGLVSESPQKFPPQFMVRARPRQPLHEHVTISSPKLIELPESVLHCEEKSLDSISLAPQVIRDLFMEYVHHYHPILPVVDISKGPERIHRLCPALFWVIMFVALRRVGDDKLLLLSLSPLVKNVLAEISISPITRYNPTEDDEPILNACSVYSVQAFILYSLWPPLTSSLSADSSWNTIGVALFQAIRIGLHSSGHTFGQAQEQTALAQEQTKTWILCNIVSETIATAFGFPAFVQFDFLSAQKCDIPVTTRHIMEIAHFEDQVAKTLTMGSNTESGLMHINERIALVKVLLKQLDDLEIRLVAESSHEDGHRKFHYLVARIHLLTCYFLDGERLPPFELSKGLVHLFNASVALMSHVDACEARAKNFVKYLPVVSILHIWQASCIIVKLANSPLKKVIDVEHAKSIYLTAIRLVGKASVLKHDISYRASGIMRNMWQLFRTLDEKGVSNLNLKIKSRMTASVFFDCLSLLRDKVGMEKLHINTDLRDKDAVGADGDDGNLPDDSDDSSALGCSEDEQNASQACPAAYSNRTAGESQKTTPGSSSSSSARPRKKRRLSGGQDHEYQARQIIRTIPLDPQPIAASASGRSTIFKVVNPSSITSPSVSVKTDDSRGQMSPPVANTAPVFSNMDYPQSMRPPAQFGDVMTEQKFVSPPSQDLNGLSASDTSANLDSNLFYVNNDLLWKDVDSLMNDFGFHPH